VNQYSSLADYWMLIYAADAKVMGLWGEIETGLYKGLSLEGSTEALRVN
jgi:hypothetical protein